MKKELLGLMTLRDDNSQRQEGMMAQHGPQTDGDCPICQDSRKDVTSALPCHHRFCLGCILRWAHRNPSFIRSSILCIISYL
uniref:RING-type domain-containing protein n=1 Tax=Zonotrichia albicollis TaxID=44394 RepID=A0A8D2MC78_ZONAL